MPPVVLAAPAVPGETAPILRLAADLSERGHEVSVVAGRASADAVTAAGARFVPVPVSADPPPERVAEIFAQRASIPPGPAQLNHDWTHFFVDPMPAQHEVVQTLLAEQPDAALVTNSLFLGPWAVALGAPGLRPRRWVAVGANPLVLSGPETGPFGPLPGQDGPERRAATLGAHAGLAAALEPTRARAQEHVRALGGDGQVPSLMDGFVTVPDVFAALSVPELDFPRSNAPENLRYVGILTPRPPRGWEPPAWWDELDGGRPVVVVTQGTAANDDLTQLVEPTLGALAEQDVLVVAALGRDPAALGSPVPDNVRAEAFVPFAELMPRADVLVTNGGYGGTQLALAAGVPVVVAGATEDKPLTAARIAFHGLGVDLGTSTPTAAQVGEAVASVLGDPAVAGRVRALAASYARHDPVDLIEEMLR